MKRWLALGMLLLLLLSACGKKEALTLSFSELDFSSVTQIRLQNAHNGGITLVTDGEAVHEICAFLQQVSGRDGGSAKGYYEGTYSLTLYEGEEKILSFAFGDSDSIYCGDFGDGYPVRYLLNGMTIPEIVNFLSPYDQSIQ